MLTEGQRRLPDRHRRRRPGRPGRAPRRRGRPPARPRRLPVRARQRALVVRRRHRLDDRVQRHLGGRRDPADARPRATTSSSTRPASRRSTAPRTRSSGPTAGGTGYGPPITLTPGYCTLSMLFSDWDRSGRRDLRVTQRPPLLRRRAPGAAVAGRAGRAAPAVHRRGRLGPDADLGHGHRQLRRHRRRPSRRVTSRARRDNKLQTLTGGPGKPTYRDIALQRGVTATRPFTGGDVLPSTAWHPEFADVNNDGFIDLFVSKGNVSAQADYATRDPSDLLLGQPDGTFVEAADAAGRPDVRQRPRRGPRRLQPRRAARPRRGEPTADRDAALAERRGRATPRRPPRWATGSGCG